jgi:hypothetical protein
MSNANESAERRADLLSRLQETGDRHDAAEQDRQDAEERAVGPEVRLLRQAIEELRSAAAETRQLNAEMREGFLALLEEIRRGGRRY